MRRFFVRYGAKLFLAILFLAFIGTGIIIISAKEKASDVVYDLYCYYGDANLLNGLNLTTVHISNYGRNEVGSEEYVWKTEIAVSDEKAECTSDFFISADWRKDRRIKEKNFSYVEGSFQLPHIYEDSDLADGVYRTVDFLEEKERYYDASLHEAGDDVTESNYQKCEGLRELFKIPIIEDAHWRAENGWIGEDEFGMYGDFYFAYAYSAATENWCAMWLTNKTLYGNYVDFSEVKDGYGVYLLPVRGEWESDDTYASYNSFLDVEGFCNICPLPESSVIWDVTFSEDEKNLYILTVEEDDNAYLTVVDIPSQTVIATIKAFAFDNGKLKWSRDAYFEYSGSGYNREYFLFPTEKGCVIQTLDEILLIHPNTEGKWEIAMEIEIPSKEDYKEGWELNFDRNELYRKTGCQIDSLKDTYTSFYSYRGNIYCYDGERLVLIFSDSQYFHLAVFRNNELECAAVLTNADPVYLGTVKGALR